MSHIAPAGALLLRGDLEIQETGDPERPGALMDAALGRRVRLDSKGLEAVRMLCRPHTLAELADELDVSEQSAARIVAFLERFQLLDSPEIRASLADAARTREIHAADTAEVPLLIRDDAAFTCTMCGSCCGGHNVGPVMDDVLAGLDGHLPKLEARTQGRKGLFFSIAGAEPGQKTTVCHSAGGSCVFLSEAGRCVIHEELGGDAKPRICRLFPYQFMATPEGIAVSLQMECRGFVEARAGRPLRDQEAALRELLAIAPMIHQVPPILALDEETTLSWADYERLEAALHGAVDAHPRDDLAALVALRDVLAQHTAQRRDVADSVAALRDDLMAVLARFDHAVAAMDEHFHADTEHKVVHTDSLDQLRTALRTLPFEMRRVAQPLERASMSELFVDKVHHQLMGKDLLTARTVEVGLAQMAFSWLLSKALMIARARQVKRRHLVAQDALDAMVTLNFLFRNEQLLDVLGQLDGPIVDLFGQRLPALLAASGRIAPEDPRVELYKF